MLVVLHGGDGRLTHQIDQIVTAAKSAGGSDVFKGKSVAYVMVALEPLMQGGASLSQSAIEATVETVIKPAFMAGGALRVDLIGGAEIERMLTYGCVLLSGGDTAHLLRVLAEAGIGIEAGKVSRFTGMGIVRGCVRPHAETHPERKEIAGDATPLGAAAVAYTVSL